MPETDAHSLPDMKDEDAGNGPTSHPGARAQQDWGATSAGLTGDRVAHRDVWSAQAGTDDEAGGGVAGAGRTPEPVVAPEASTQARDPNFSNERTPRAPWIWIAVALIAVAVLGAFLLGALSPD